MSALVPAAASDAHAHLRELVTDGVRSPHSKRAYAAALDEFLAWSHARGPFSKALITAYRAWLEERKLAPSTINVRLAAVRKLAEEAADNGFLAGDVAAAIARVKGARRHGVRAGNWLDRRQTEALLTAPDSTTTKGLRDRAILAVLVGCGLRRGETVSLTVNHIQLRDGRWAIVDLDGKHGRIRSVPMPAWTKSSIDAWTAAAGIAGGAIFRAVAKGGAIAAVPLTPQAVYYIVEEHARALGLDIRPHDLRRTFGKLAHKGGAPLEQIQLSYGHASLTTTERYLGVRQDFADAPCDRLGLRGAIAHKAGL
ncbi:MAG: tyrosine-type recombinase/integrase [Bryobacteraceae bacterium]